MNKIVHLDKLMHNPQALKRLKKPAVLVGGCFDILHLGHVRFLKEAKRHGAVYVALESDENLRKYKGISRPIHVQLERAEVLAELSSVDYIIILPSLKADQDYFELTKLIHPDFIIVTEGDPQLPNKTKQASLVGAELVIVPKIKTPSTTQLAKLLSLEKV